MHYLFTVRRNDALPVEETFREFSTALNANANANILFCLCLQYIVVFESVHKSIGFAFYINRSFCYIIAIVAKHSQSTLIGASSDRC